MQRPCQYIAAASGERCGREPAKSVGRGFSWQTPDPVRRGRTVTFYAEHLCEEHEAFALAHRAR